MVWLLVKTARKAVTIAGIPLIERAEFKMGQGASEPVTVEVFPSHGVIVEFANVHVNEANMGRKFNRV